MIAPRLAIFIFLQYFALGMWFVALGGYMSQGLHFDGIIGLAYASQGLAAVASTLFVGALTDRFLSKRVALAGLMLASGASLLLLAEIHAGQTLFLAVILAHFLVFVPTIPLSTAVCLEALPIPEAQFARIRVCGTIGWVVSGFVIGAIPHAGVTSLPLQLAAATMLVLAGCAFVLPRGEPPVSDGQPFTLVRALGLDVLAQIRNRSFWVVIGCTTLISAPLAFYNAYCNTFLQETGVVLVIGAHRFEPTAIQALGQVSEMAFLLLLPRALRKFDIRGVLILGMAAWIVRALCFLIAIRFPDGHSLALILPGILLHGMCYDFMLVGAALYVDRVVGSEARARAQSFLTFMTMGVGVMLGSLLANTVYVMATRADGAHDWSLFWLVVAGLALVALVTFVASFGRGDARQPS